MARASTLQRSGGIAALVMAVTFVVGFTMAVTVLADYVASDPTPAESAAFVAGHQAALYVWYLVIYLVFGFALVPLVLALADRLRAGPPELVRPATAFGILWAGLVLASGMVAIVGLGTVEELHAADPARAEPVWSALDAVQNALGGGMEVVGAAWVLLVSAAALRAGALPRRLSLLGAVSGVGGALTVLPALEAAGAVFGLGLIAWFAWVGFVLLRGPTTRRRVPTPEASHFGAVCL